jgi:hypothetical protein
MARASFVAFVSLCGLAPCARVVRGQVEFLRTSARETTQRQLIEGFVAGSKSVTASRLMICAVGARPEMAHFLRIDSHAFSSSPAATY